MIDFILCASSNLFRMVLIYRFVVTFLGRAEKNKVKEFLVYACFYIVNTFLFWEFHTIWINVLCNLIGIGIIVRLRTKSVKTILFVTCSIYLINMGCDVVGTSPIDSYKAGKVNDQTYAVLTVLLIFICELVTERVVISRKRTEIPPNLSLAFVPVCSVAVIFALTYLEVRPSIEMAIVCIGLLAINFFVLYQYNLLLQSARQKYEMEMLEAKAQIYASRLDDILQSEEKIKILRHDMKHHMNELKLMANRHGVVEIQEYIDRMEDFIANPKEIVNSGNMEIDSVLNYMLQKAREELKTVTVHVLLPEKIKHSFDINVLLGNLLENAIEAAGQTEKQYLNVDISMQTGILKIQIANSYLGQDTVNGDAGIVWRTTKKAKEEHGIGLKSVKKIVEIHNGIMDITTQDEIFCVKLILYMPESED